MMRRLVCTRRHVALDRADEYLLAWMALRNVATARAARAWLFRGTEHEDQFMEFIEWDAATAAPLADEDIQAALSQLDAFGPPVASEEWEEAT